MRGMRKIYIQVPEVETYAESNCIGEYISNKMCTALIGITFQLLVNSVCRWRFYGCAMNTVSMVKSPYWLPGCVIVFTLLDTDSVLSNQDDDDDDDDSVDY